MKMVQAALALVLVISVAAPLVLATPSPAPLQISVVNKVVTGDTYMFSIRHAGSFNLLGDSSFIVKGTYPTGGVQDEAAVIGVIKYVHSASCPPAATGDPGPCFLAQVGRTMKDVAVGSSPNHLADLTVDLNPNTNLVFSREHDHGAFNTLTTGVEWSGVRGFQKNASDPAGHQVTYRFFVTVPGADRLLVNIHLHSHQTLAIKDEVWHAGGFAFWGDDYNAMRADSMPAEVLIGSPDVCGSNACGIATVHQPAGTPTNYLYGTMGPTPTGVYIVHNHLNGFTCVGPGTGPFQCPVPFLPTATAGQYGYFSNTESQAVILGASAELNAFVLSPQFIVVLGSKTTGAHNFWVNYHAGAGSQDLLSAGFTGPIA